MRISTFQGLYHVAAGAWPVMHLSSFEAVTGRKKDGWLVKTIGWLFILSGIELLSALRSKDAALTGIGWAAIIGGADVYYGGVKHRISRIYLVDGILQFGIMYAWIKSLRLVKSV